MIPLKTIPNATNCTAYSIHTEKTNDRINYINDQIKLSKLTFTSTTIETETTITSKRNDIQAQMQQFEQDKKTLSIEKQKLISFLEQEFDSYRDLVDNTSISDLCNDINEIQSSLKKNDC